MIHVHCDCEESQVRCDDVLVWGRDVVAPGRQGAESLD